MQIRTGIWVNTIKLRNTLVKLTFFYGFILLIIGVLEIISKQYFVGGLFVFFSLPLWLIQRSYSKYNKSLEGVKEDVRK